MFQLWCAFASTVIFSIHPTPIIDLEACSWMKLLPFVIDQQHVVARVALAVRRRWFQSQRHNFQRACLNFLHVLQIDWYGGFRCRCPGGPSTEFTADGIVMGIPLKQLCLQHPFRPSQDAPLAAGVTLVSCCMLPAAARQLLSLLCSTAGLPPDRLQELRGSLADGDGSTLLPFIRETKHVRMADGSRSPGDEQRALPEFRGVLQCLGTTAPADNLLPRVLWQHIEKLISGQLLTATESSELSLSAKLGAFLRPLVCRGPCSPAVVAFLTALLKVSISRQGWFIGRMFHMLEHELQLTFVLHNLLQLPVKVLQIMYIWG